MIEEESEKEDLFFFLLQMQVFMKKKKKNHRSQHNISAFRESSGLVWGPSKGLGSGDV